jgi:dephospho-CoA kinase
VRAERAGSRGHEALAERGARQLSGEEKAARADHVVRNDGTIPELELALSDVLDKLGEQ